MDTEEKTEKRPVEARKFSNMFRFRDYLAAINDGGEFEKV